MNGFIINTPGGQPITVTKTYGNVTLTCSSTHTTRTTAISDKHIGNLFDNNASTNWLAIGNTGKYLNSAGNLITYTQFGDGGSYSNSNIYNSNFFTVSSAPFVGTGIYVGARYSSTINSSIITTYNTSLTASGEFIDISINSEKFMLVKSIYMAGNSSFNWDDFPYKIIILGSNDDGTNWNLIKDGSSDFSTTTIVTGNTITGPRNSTFLKNNIKYAGYSGDDGYNISSITTTYPVNANVYYNRIRIVITELIRGRVLSLNTFNMFFDVY